MKPRIDAHQHFWRYDPKRDTWITDSMSGLRRDYLPEDLLGEVHRNQMDASIVVQADQSENETAFLLDLAERYSFIAGVVGWVDLRARNLPELLGHYSHFKKLRGFRHIVQSEPDDRFLLRDEVVRGIGYLQQFNFTYDILIYPKQMPAVLGLMERLPNQRFVIDHIAKPPIRAKQIASWANLLRAIASNPLVYCKVSGLITEVPGRGVRVVWDRPPAVWFGLASVPACRYVRASEGTDCGLYEGPARLGAGKRVGRECRAVL